MKRLNISFLVISILTFFLSPQILYSESPNKDKIKIGLIYPLTGDVAVYGEAAKNGAILARETLSADLKDRVELIFEDDALNPRQTALAYQKLVKIDKVDGILTWPSGTAKAIAPMAEEDRMPTLAVAASDPNISKGRQYISNFWIIPETETEVLLPELKRRGIKRVAFATTIHEGALAVKNAFKSISNGEIEIVFDQEVPPEERDHRAWLSRLAAKKGQFDALVMSLMPPQPGTVARQFRELGFEQAIIGYETLEDTGAISTANGALEGALIATAGIGESWFLDSYAIRFPGAPNFTAAESRDAVTLMVKALGSKDPASYVRELKNFKGATGTFSSLGDGRFSFPASLKIIENAKVIPYKG